MPKPTDAWVRWLITPALVFIAQATSTTYLADFWHHLARGRYIVEEGRILNHDIFTYTVAGRTFQDPNWLTQAIYFLVYEAGGLDLVRVANALALALALAILVGHCRRASGSLAVASGVGILVFLGVWQVLTVRPQTLSLLLFALLYDLLDRSRERPWLLVWTLPIMTLWANLHGAYPAGLMLVGCFLAAALVNPGGNDDRRPSPQGVPLALALGGGFLATLLNPYGWRIYQYVRFTANTAGARRIDEWLPPSWDDGIGIAFFASLILLVGFGLAAWIKHGQKPMMREWWLIGLFLPLACGSARMAVWWLVIVAPLIARRIAWFAPKPAAEDKPSGGAALSVGLLGLAMIVSVPGCHRFNPLLAWRSPSRTEQDLDQVQAFLAGRPEVARIFCRFEWGEYAAWKMHPRQEIFMDGRIEIYPDDVWASYAMVTCGQEGWADALDAFGVEALILDETYHRRTGLLVKIEQSSVWRRTFQAGQALVFERNLKPDQDSVARQAAASR